MSDTTDFEKLREDYNGRELDRSDLKADPFDQFDEWFQNALDADVHLPDAMSLATCAPDGQPTVRTVVLRGHGPEGFRFFTGLNSRKAQHLKQNPRTSLTFYWKPFHRQVRIEGEVERVPRDDVEEYFATRPRNSQLAAHVSDQQDVVESRDVLQAELDEARQRFDGQDVPCPDDWGGFLLKPHCFYFWQGRAGRLHDRFRYQHSEDDSWTLDRIAP